jgi:hypothetical protein
MPFVLSKIGKQFQTFRAGEDGKPTGEALGSFDVRILAENQIAKLSSGEGKVLTSDELANIKCYGESEYSYVPWGVSTLKDALAAQEAQEDAREIQSLGTMYKQIVDNILGNSELKDKAKAITALASEFASELKDTASGEKAVDTISDTDHMLIKSLGNDRVGSHAVLWGDETKKDFTGEYFDRATEELTSIFDTVGKLPYIYHHALDGTLKTRVTGIVDVLRVDDIGLWYEAQLLMADEYDAQIKKLFLEGKLKTSSQTFPAARRVSKTGHIERWPIIEITATPTPAEYRMQPVEFLKTAYANLGIDLDRFSERYADRTQGVVKARALLNIQRLRLLGDYHG